MRQKATEAARAELPPEQARALAALASGATVTEVAKAARRDRTTLHRWLRGDHGFRAAHNSLRADLRRVEAAVEAVESCVRAGDLRAAVAIGPDDPAELAEEDELARRARASERTVRNLTAF